ncbi:hypothetical protein [Paenibacillus guangzhouensis]|uniref:hypothetical protein n=1 Tax=Paenibacillus guangzhouensis TaxID=1473112 RepID=UPI0012672567|nr:hypothetical protein [Paenibacillus guangzhouensis]
MIQGQTSVLHWGDLLQQYRTLIYILLEKKNEAHISTVTVTELSKVLRLSHADIASRIKKCIGFGILEAVEPTGFRVLQSDLTYTPIGYMAQLLQVIKQLPESSFEQQADAMQISVKELESVYGYFLYLLL